MSRSLWMMVFAACLSCGVGDAAHAKTPGNGSAVVELYTSQGCSSCPPADELLGELARMPNVTALAFHVDYWDGLGWRDAFASRQSTGRQRRYVETLGLPSAFTPQVVIDGRGSFVGSDRRRILAALTEARQVIPVEASVTDGDLIVTIPESSVGGHYEVNLAAYRPTANTRISGGENSGKTLQEFNVVREFRSLGMWNGERREFRTAVSGFPGDATRVAVLLQGTGQGPIAGSAVAVLR